MRKLIAAIILCNIFLFSCSPQSKWVLLHPRNNPPPLALGGFAYDKNSREAVIFGGIYRDKWSDDTWIWDGNDWHNANPPDRPSAREKTAMAYDESRNKIVLFGGKNDTNIYGDTWEWDGKTWQLLKPVHKPSARCCHAMAYDSVQKKVLLYAGWNGTPDGFFKDTWAWDGKDWTALPSSDVPLNSSHMMVNFASKNKIVVVPAPQLVNTWEWDGTNWKEIYSLPNPSRQDGRSLFDNKNNRIILFGGYGNETFLDDLWIYDGSIWSKLNVPSGPAPRFGHFMFYDEKRQSIIMFGGAGKDGVVGDTWELKLSNNISNLMVTPIPTQ